MGSPDTPNTEENETDVFKKAYQLRALIQLAHSYRNSVAYFAKLLSIAIKGDDSIASKLHNKIAGIVGESSTAIKLPTQPLPDNRVKIGLIVEKSFGFVKIGSRITIVEINLFEDVYNIRRGTREELEAMDPKHELLGTY